MVTTTKQSARVQSELKVKATPAPETETMGGMTDMTADDVRQMVEAHVRSAFERYLATPREEQAEPLYWWDIYAWGPYQPGASLTPPSGFSGPLLSNQVIRAGELAYVATIILLNTSFPSPGPSAAEILSKFALPYEVEYGTGELKKWTLGPANLQHVSSGNLTPGVPWAVDVFPFVVDQEGIYEMNINARIFGCDRNIAPPFAAYATLVEDIDSDLFGIGPRVKTEQSIRFHCYR